MNSAKSVLDARPAYLKPPLGDMRLEVIVLPVSDVDSAREFYSDLDWRLDIDISSGDAYRVIQSTPPGSSCSIMFGTGITTAQPGSAEPAFDRVRRRSNARQAA